MRTNVGCPTSSLKQISYSGTVFTMFPQADVNIARSIMIKSRVAKQASQFGNFDKYANGSSEYVEELTQAIVRSVDCSMSSLRSALVILRQ